MDDRVLAIGFVPNRVNVDACFPGVQDGTELSPALVCEAVTDA
jgi:carbon monoxide dehydrogenase subunit G